MQQMQTRDRMLACPQYRALGQPWQHVFTGEPASQSGDAVCANLQRLQPQGQSMLALPGSSGRAAAGVSGARFQYPTLLPLAAARLRAAR